MVIAKDIVKTGKVYEKVGSSRFELLRGKTC